VYVIAREGSRVAIGGDFQTLGRARARANLAVLDGRTGKLLPWNVRVGGRDCDLAECVSRLVLAGSTLYVGGSFSRVGGLRRTHLAAVNMITGRVEPWNPSPDAAVTALAVSGSTVYVGGEFTRIGGQRRTNLAAVDAATGQVKAWNPKPEGFVSIEALAVAGSTVYVGGRFDRIGGGERHGLAALEASTARATNWNPNPTDSGQSLFFVRTLVPSGPTVYVGGRFQTIGTEPETDWPRSTRSPARSAPGTRTPAATSGSWRRRPEPSTRAGTSTRSAPSPAASPPSCLDGASGPVGWNPNIPGAALVEALLSTSTAVYVGGHFPGAIAAFPHAR
jgi:hypothetical protein